MKNENLNTTLYAERSAVSAVAGSGVGTPRPADKFRQELHTHLHRVDKFDPDDISGAFNIFPIEIEENSVSLKVQKMVNELVSPVLKNLSAGVSNIDEPPDVAAPTISGCD